MMQGYTPQPSAWGPVEAVNRSSGFLRGAFIVFHEDEIGIHSVFVLPLALLFIVSITR